MIGPSANNYSESRGSTEGGNSLSLRLRLRPRALFWFSNRLAPNLLLLYRQTSGAKPSRHSLTFSSIKSAPSPHSLSPLFSYSLPLSLPPIFAEMVMALGPGRFYGSSLPRPRFYTEVKLNEDRVDPPVPVMDPLLSWANEAHWSMGGLRFKRHRLQGRIEGSIKKLRAQQERTHRNSPSLDRNPTTKPRFSGHIPQSLASLRSGSSESEPEEEEEVQKKTKDASIVSSPSIGSAQKRKRVRRLGDEFDRIAEQQQMGKKTEAVEGVASRTRSRKSDVEEVELAEEPAVAGKGSAERRKRKEVDGAKPRRTSPRKKLLI